MYNDELAHYGVKGMKWGVRRYQNPDGSLTTDGKKRTSNTKSDKDHKEIAKKAAIGAAAVAGVAIMGVAVNRVVKNRYAMLAGKEAYRQIMNGTFKGYHYRTDKGRKEAVAAVRTARANARNRSFKTASKGVANYYTDRLGYKIGGKYGNRIVNRKRRFDVPEIPIWYRE